MTRRRPAARLTHLFLTALLTVGAAQAQALPRLTSAPPVADSDFIPVIPAHPLGFGAFVPTQDNPRDAFVANIQLLLDGKRPDNMTDDSLQNAGLCAQFTRQLDEGSLGLPNGAWRYYAAAGRIAQAAHQGRYASHYEAAARQLGLNTLKARVGDVMFWPWVGPDNVAYGHMATYVVIDGVEYALENTVANRGIRILGDGPVRLTKLSDITRWEGPPRTIALPAAELAGIDPTVALHWRGETVSTEIPPVTPPAPAPAPVPSTASTDLPVSAFTPATVVPATDPVADFVAGLAGTKLILIVDGKQQPWTTVDKVTAQPGKLYIKVKTK